MKLERLVESLMSLVSLAGFFSTLYLLFVFLTTPPEIVITQSGVGVQGIYQYTPRKGKTSPRTRSRPELAWKLERKDRTAASLAFHLRFCFSRAFLLLPGGPADVAVVIPKLVRFPR